MAIELPDELLDAMADQLAPRIAERLVDAAPASSSPWLTVEEAAEYTRIALGTFRKQSANGTFTAHGGKRKVYHRDELDEALGRASPPDTATLRRAN
jgi:excisionase family DNA binding protein